MNQCQRCGTFFEGPVCPDCGMPRTTLCPRCGAPNYATAPACGCCGLLFAPQRYTPPKPCPPQPLYEQPAPRAVHAPKKPSPAPAAAAVQEEKNKSPRVAITVTVILLAIVIAIIAIAGYFISLHSTDGTYYRIDNNDYVFEEYLVLNGRTWKDDGGETGEFTLSGNSIVIKQSLMGETIILFTGIVEDGQLRLRFMGQELIFAQKGAYIDVNGLAYKEYGDGYAVSGIGGCKDVNIKIPAMHFGLPVVAINSLNGNDDIKSVEIPNSVTEIGGGAFEYCTGLTSITIPNSVTSIGREAFSGCSGLTSITIPGSVTFGANAFEDCNILSITIGSGTTSIKSYAFSGCDWMTGELLIPNSVTSIGKNAFYNCTGLTSVAIPDSVTSIGEETFSGCTKLTSITIGSGVTSIGKNAFYNCSGLTSILVEQGNPIYHSAGNCLIETASSTLISGCKTSTIPDDGSVTAIGDRAFAYCNGLASITIPDSVISIGEDAFCNCSGLTSIIIPDSVTAIGDGAFFGCKGLKNITIPDSVTSIGEWAFYDCNGLTSVTIGNSVTKIGRCAFEDCARLTSITIPDSVTSIGFGAFSDCNKLKTVYYKGTAEDWNGIKINYNDNLLSATRYYFTEDEPTAEEWASWKYWWHYDAETGRPTPWTKA